MQTDSAFDKAVRWIVNTSAEEGIKYGVCECNDLDVLREAQRRELSKPYPRKGLLVSIERRIRRLEKEAV